MSGIAAREDDARWMALALTLGRRGMGRVWPNPAVGCVIVNKGRVVGRGWTQDGGRPHAEVVALAQAGQAARGADVFVSLEPCAHTGQTPPCAQALIEAKVARVVVALEDPDLRVSGRGTAMLKDAGIDVVTGVLATDATDDHTGFLSRTTNGRPAVTLKLAMSLDGRIATASGESQWITGEVARREGHMMRARHDAVLVGAGTARADLPSLTVRRLGIERQPVRVVMSRGLNLPLQGPLFETAHDVPVWIIHGASAPVEVKKTWKQAGATLIEVADGMDVRAALRALGQAGLTRVYCEGGGALAAALLRANAVDRLVVMKAGLILGSDGLAGVGQLGKTSLDAVSRFKLHEQRRVGDDTLEIWRRD